jgi:hypothetical protein
MAGFHRLLGRVDQAEVDEVDARPRDFSVDAGELPLEASLQTVELWPVSIQADTEKADFGFGVHQ